MSLLGQKSLVGVVVVVIANTCSVPDTVLNKGATRVNLIQSSQQPFEGRAVVPMLQLRNRKHRELKTLAQGGVAGQCGSQGWRPGRVS